MHTFNFGFKVFYCHNGENFAKKEFNNFLQYLHTTVYDSNSNDKQLLNTYQDKHYSPQINAVQAARHVASSYGECVRN